MGESEIVMAYRDQKMDGLWSTLPNGFHLLYKCIYQALFFAHRLTAVSTVGLSVCAYH